MSWQDARLWSALISIDGIGPKTLHRLLRVVRERGLTAEAAWSHLNPDSCPFLSSKSKENWCRLRRAYTLTDYAEWLETQNIGVITELHPGYPELLTQIPDRPPVLFVKGPPELKLPLPIAVVGTRRATPYGKLAVEKIVTELVGLGGTVISGFMYGIDVLAHETAIKAGGKTVGVLGFGFNYMYPRSQARLFDEWLANGHTFITEFAPATAPTKGTFVRRNRIVAGLARGVVVVEAGINSGSLVTAQAALDYGREVMAVPGPFHSIYSEGTTWLLNQGASLITSGRQIIETVGGAAGLLAAANVAHLSLADSFQQHIYSELRVAPRSENDLQLLVRKPMNQVLTALSMMEVAGWLKKAGDVWVVNI